MKFSLTLSVEHSRMKMNLNLKLHTSERYYLFLKFENLGTEFFDVFLRFDLPSAHFLNFPQNSARSLIGPFFIIGDCMVLLTLSPPHQYFWHSGIPVINRHHKTSICSLPSIIFCYFQLQIKYYVSRSWEQSTYFCFKIFWNKRIRISTI